MTQILKLNFLTPEIQEKLLFLAVDTWIFERALRTITTEASWDAQRRMWRKHLTTARKRRLPASERSGVSVLRRLRK